VSALVAGRTVPYIAAWSDEKRLPGIVASSPMGRVRYVDESEGDRDGNGVLWVRHEDQRGAGRPVFDEVHPLRQRHAMENLLCQVCAEEPDCNADGVLWVMVDNRDDWPRWPNRMVTYDAPVCVPCARIASRSCPALRNRKVLIRSRTHPVMAVKGDVYASSPAGMVMTGMGTVLLDSPTIRWTVAHQLLRRLSDCVIIGTDSDCL
jgi:hypothetical protein